VRNGRGTKRRVLVDSVCFKEVGSGGAPWVLQSGGESSKGVKGKKKNVYPECPPRFCAANGVQGGIVQKKGKKFQIRARKKRLPFNKKGKT